VETQLRKKPLRGSQTQEFNYSEDKAYKVITLTYPDVAVVPCTLMCAYTRTLPSQVSYLKGSLMDSFSFDLLPKLDFTRTISHTGQLLES
jgi:hypothetical protein